MEPSADFGNQRQQKALPEVTMEEKVEFVVGFKLNGKHDHMVVEGEDGLVAALKVKAECPECAIIYVRRQNKRGDARHPSPPLPNEVFRGKPVGGV